MELKDKVVLVTGGGSGIGLGVAQAFAAEGCKVVITGRGEERLNAAAKTVEAAHPIRVHACDVSSREQVNALFQWVEKEVGTVDILVNSAGVNIANRAWSNIDPAEFEKVMAINLNGTFYCTHAALPAMRGKKEGFICNVISVAGKQVLKLAGLPYCTSKFAAGAVGTFTNLEEAEHGIKVTNVFPGETNTPILDQRPVPPPPEKRAQMVHPEDVAACVITIAKLPPRAVVPEIVITPPYMILG